MLEILRWLELTTRLNVPSWRRSRGASIIDFALQGVFCMKDSRLNS